MRRRRNDDDEHHETKWNRNEKQVQFHYEPRGESHSRVSLKSREGRGDIQPRTKEFLPFPSFGTTTRYRTRPILHNKTTRSRPSWSLKETWKDDLFLRHFVHFLLSPFFGMFCCSVLLLSSNWPAAVTLFLQDETFTDFLCQSLSLSLISLLVSFCCQELTSSSLDSLFGRFLPICDTRKVILIEMTRNWVLTSLLGVKTMMKKRTSWEFLPMLAACFNLAMATCLFCNEGRAHIVHNQDWS